MNKCKNLLKRQRKYKPYFYCKALRKEIILPCDKSCSNLILKRNKGINKVGKKRIFVTEDTYNKVYKRDNGKCQLCGISKNLQLHHIVYRSENKQLINEPTNCIMLCNNCHRLVHSNKHLWQPILLEKNKKFL